MTDIYLVAGATGGLGQQIVSKLLLAKQHVRTLVRDIEKARALLGENLEHFIGDTRQIDTLLPAVDGVHTIICATGTRTPEGANNPEMVDYEGVRNLVLAAKQVGVKRFILVSTIAVTHPEHPLNQFGQVLDWKAKGEASLRESGIPYVIVRPGGLTDEPSGEQRIRFDQGDQISGRIARGNVAEAIVQAALHFPDANNITLEVIETDGQPLNNWAAMFGDLKTDREQAANG